MSLCKEQIRVNGRNEVPSGKVRKRLTKERNRYIRRESKNIKNENPKSNYYRGWAY